MDGFQQCHQELKRREQKPNCYPFLGERISLELFFLKIKILNILSASQKRDWNILSTKGNELREKGFASGF